MYAFTVISALCCVIEEHKSFVKYWYVLLSLPQEYVYVQNVYVWLKFALDICVCVCMLEHVSFFKVALPGLVVVGDVTNWYQERKVCLRSDVSQHVGGPWR
jgi:hypothetical protein